jgi:hypothetical protein
MKLSLSRKTIAILGAFFILGLIARFSQYNHLGFYYDLIETQYDWARTLVNDGFFSFWKSYPTGRIDYLPGAMYVIGAIQYLNTWVFGGGEYGFVALIKIFNTLNDLVFAGIITYLAKKYGNATDKFAAILGTATFLLPSLWFISAVWGQFDTFPINISMIMCVLLYRALSEQNNRFGLISGILFGATIWFKLQAVLLLPAIILLAISAKKMKPIKSYLNGFGISTVVILGVAAIANIERLGYVIGQVVLRSNNVTNGAATFWRLVNMVKYGNDDWFNIGSLTITASRFALVVYIVLMTVFVWSLFRLQKATLRYPKRALMNIKIISMQSFFLVTAISSSIYFFFFTKMMSRYLHWGYLFGIGFLALNASNVKMRKPLITSLLLIEIGYFFNQIEVYGWWNGTPNWPEWISRNTPLYSWNVASWLFLVGIGTMFYTAIKYLHDQELPSVK